MRAGIVLVAFLPFLYYATKDHFFHFRGRQVTIAEHILHLAIGLSLAVVLGHAVLGNSGLMLAGLLMFAVTGAVDEYVWHRGIPEEESDLHAKEHLALLIFVVVALVVHWLEQHQWQIPAELRSVIPGLSPSVESQSDSGSLFAAGPWWRPWVIPVFLIPYAWFGLNDNLHHVKHRSVGWTERILHLTIVLALFTVVPHAMTGNRSVMLAGLLLFLVARSWDEWGFHRNLPGHEADMHAKTHLAFLIFVVMSTTVDWMITQHWVDKRVHASVSFPEIHPSYAIPILAALLLGVMFPVARHLTDGRERRQYYLLQLITFVSAIVGAKVVFLFAEYGWPLQPIDDWPAMFFSGRSIVGALLFGLLGAELAKPLVKYTLPPNDRFAALLPFTIAIGRVGCLMSGCCRGVPTDSPLAIHYADGVARHPAQVYEMIFHLVAGITAIWLIRHQQFRGSVFSLYLIAYGGYRFASEFIRETPIVFSGWSAYQWLSLVMIAVGAGFLLKRTFLPSDAWKAHFADTPSAA